MYPLPAPIITSKSQGLLSEMVHDAAVILMLKAIRVYTVTAITEIMMVTSRLTGVNHTSILDGILCMRLCSVDAYACFILHYIHHSDAELCTTSIMYSGILVI